MSSSTISINFERDAETLNEGGGVLNRSACSLAGASIVLGPDQTERLTSFDQKALEGRSLGLYRKLAEDHAKLPASSKDLVLRLWTLEGSWALGQVDSLVVPGATGELCLLKRHVDYYGKLDPGILKIRWRSAQSGREDFFYVLTGSGVLILRSNVVNVFGKSVEDPYSYSRSQISKELAYAEEEERTFREFAFGSGAANLTEAQLIALLAKGSTKEQEEGTTVRELKKKVFALWVKWRKELFLSKVRLKACDLRN